MKGYPRPPYRFSVELDGELGKWLEGELERRNGELPEDYLARDMSLWNKRKLITELLERERKRITKRLAA